LKTLLVFYPLIYLGVPFFSLARQNELFDSFTLFIFTYERIIGGFVVDYGKQFLFVCGIIKIGNVVI